MIDNKKLVAMFKDLGYVNSEGISNKSTRERAGIDRRLENELLFAISQGIDKQFDKLTAGPRTDDDLKDFINSLRRMKLSEEQEEFCKITNTSIENIIEEAFKLKYKNALKDENTMFQDCILRMSEISGIGIDIESLKKEVHQERIAEKGMDNSGNFDPLSFLDDEVRNNTADFDPLSFLDDEVRNNTADFDPLGFLDSQKGIIERYFKVEFENPLTDFYVEPKKSPVEDLNYTEKTGQEVLSNNGIGKQGEENNNIMLNLIPTEKTENPIRRLFSTIRNAVGRRNREALPEPEKKIIDGNTSNKEFDPSFAGYGIEDGQLVPKTKIFESWANKIADKIANIAKVVFDPNSSNISTSRKKQYLPTNTNTKQNNNNPWYVPITGQEQRNHAIRVAKRMNKEPIIPSRKKSQQDNTR